jgi:glutamate dehydrogenase
VFGNGMLLSRHTKLVGAFNHLHIFCDPDPDPEVSFEERRRLFDLPRSSWTDYNTELLSPGGAIFDRKAKSLKLTPEIQTRFGLARDKVTPAELMQAMLRSEIDLLWFGGIGTFIKATEETHAEVGDKANDATRIDGREVRAKIVGEGANLGVTQRGRIEFAQSGAADHGGGRINTDAIDNSAGVDTSDHEVNIKVLTGDVLARGDMTLKQRDQLLASMTDEVGELVLSDNYLQPQAISVAGASGVGGLEEQARFMRVLEKAGHLNRAIEFLPDEEEIAARAGRGLGLTRPELAVLLAYSKITLYDQLLDSNLPDDPRMVDDLVKYFPKALRRDYREAIERHRLRREIIATYATNSMVNRVGPTFVTEMADKTGAGPGDIARAYTVSRDAFALRALWTSIESLDNKVPAAIQYEMIAATQGLMNRTIPWFLINAPQPLDLGAEAANYTPGVEELTASLDNVVCEEDRVQLGEQAGRWESQGVPADLARRVASLGVLASALDITRIARQCRREVPDAAQVYFELGHRFGMEWLRFQASRVKTENHWQKQAVSAIIDDLYGLQTDLTARIFNDGEAHEAAIATWAAARHGPVDRINQLLTELRGVARVDLAMLAVANRQLRGLIAS